MNNILETKTPDINKIQEWNISFDKDTYKQMTLDVLIEEKAKETEERLTKERETIKSWNFVLTRKNVANGNSERNELLAHIDFLASESEDKAERKFYKKVFNILEEMAKNVQKDKYYMKKWENKENKKYEIWEVSIISDENSITITTSNYTKDNISRIPERLNELNNMDEWQLREEYKTKMNEWGISERWWAWLWFIDIIRKSGGWKLECTINETDNPELKQINFSISIPKESLVTQKETVAA